MFKSKLVSSIVFIVSLLLTACRHGNDPLWNEVAAYFTHPARTKQELLSRLSLNALQAAVRQPIADTTEPIIALFRRLKNNHNYEVDKNADTVYVSFDPDAEVAGGPFFDIVKHGSSWQVINIRFGK